MNPNIIVRDYYSGMKIKDICSKHRINDKVIYRFVIPNRKVKLSLSERKYIIDAYNKGVSPYYLAPMFCVSRRRIYDVIRKGV